jgi:tetratricopeptide (TPR) repeat protein
VNATRSTSLERAQQAYARGEFVACLQHALNHLDRLPWSRAANLFAARSFSQLDYAEEAEPYYSGSGALGLNDLQIRAFGLVRGNYRQWAIQAYEEILSRWPENITALRRLAAVQLTENNLPQLEALAERLITIPGAVTMGYTLRGAVAHKERNREAAVLAFSQVLEVDPDLQLMPLPRQVFWSYFGEDLIKTGRLEDAIRYLHQGIAESSNTELLNLLGRAYMLHSMLDEADHCYRQAIEWEPTSYVPHCRLGEIQLQRQQPHEALKHLVVAYRLAPQSLEVLYRLASVYRLLQQPAEAAYFDQLRKQLYSTLKQSRNANNPWPFYSL